ncbi:hypothetical protein AAFX91_11160 [Bradyrhizobium sp. 31Argb]|uniref:hypothetical protein n=1 Tax=Bradyrhizobium sp. 31Argb TaxID=3141247 RepID=UPI0037478FF2
MKRLLAAASQPVVAAVGLIFFICTIWGLVVFLRADRLNNWLTLKQITERVTIDLPRGTPLSEIDRYFTENRIEHSYIKDINEVYAMIHFIWGGGFLIQKDASTKIQLDEDRKLKVLTVEPVFTGP